MAWELGSGESHDNLLCVSLTLKELLGVMNSLIRTRVGKTKQNWLPFTSSPRGNELKYIFEVPSLKKKFLPSVSNRFNSSTGKLVA